MSDPANHVGSDAARRVALLDANVLYSRVLSDYLVQAQDRNLIEVRWSPEILDELIRNKKKNAIESAATPADAERRTQAVDRLREYIERQYPRAVVTPRGEHYETFSDVAMSDPDDRHVVAAAVAAGADLLCTNNERHFPDAVMDRVHISRITPDHLLTRLIRDRPTEMINARQNVIEWTPRTTHRATLDTLRRANAPQAAERLTALLAPLGNLDSRDDLAQVHAEAIECARLARAGQASPLSSPAVAGSRPVRVATSPTRADRSPGQSLG